MQEELNKEQQDLIDEEHEETTEPEVILSRRKRGVAPVVGMPCATGYKLIGDDCIVANVEFE